MLKTGWYTLVFESVNLISYYQTQFHQQKDFYADTCPSKWVVAAITSAYMWCPDNIKWLICELFISPIRYGLKKKKPIKTITPMSLAFWLYIGLPLNMQ